MVAQQEILDEDELEDTFVLEREADELNPDGTFSGPASVTGIPEDLQDQLKAVVKAIKKVQSDVLPDKRKRDEVFQSIFLKTLETLAARYPTSITEDELLLKKSGTSHHARMAIEVRIGEKKLLQEAMTAAQSDGDVEMEEDDSGPQKRAKRT